eukprot:NODE_11_length_46995_cov_0.451872.p17 type:complete len:314 gc:universal NODE_11_length_46995_cov_0.451872:35347-36288(+)
MLRKGLMAYNRTDACFEEVLLLRVGAFCEIGSKILSQLHIKHFVHLETMEEENSLPVGTSFQLHCLAGSLAGIAEHSLVFPIDTLKTRQQVLFTLPSKHSLWSGVQSIIIGAGPAHALQFSVYEFCKSATNPTLAAAMGTMVGELIQTPFDTVKQRMQCYNYSTIRECVSKVYSREGLRPFYISYPVTLSITVPFNMIHFSIYEALKPRLLVWRNTQNEYDPLIICIGGGIAGGIASIFTNPLDLLKTTLQTRGEMNPNFSKLDSISILKKAYHQDGIKTFFRGALPRVATHVPSTAIVWSVYEYIKFAMNSF